MSFADSARAALSASPVLRIATPSTKPLNTSQKADEAKPPKITSGGAILAVIAAVKNSSAVINSGNSDVAHSTMVTPTISEGSSRGYVNQSDIPVSCRIFQQVYGDRQPE
ncbi:Uncharacterised protein [Enterobacter asburiae]|nr:Uncharacterised protein [Enterobacter asburiae]